MYVHPIFQLNEFENWKRAKGEIKDSSIHSSINYLIGSGQIKRIRRELFGVIPPNENANTVNFDKYLIAAKIVDDSILAYHTALELHGLAYSSFEQLTFLTNKKIKPLEIYSNWFQSVQTPKVLKDEKLENFFTQEIDRQGVKVKITNISRTFVDVIDRHDLSGGWEEVVRSVSNIATLNVEEVFEYCLTRKNNTLSAKVGYFLEQRIGAFSPPIEIIEKLIKLSPSKPQYIGNIAKEKHKLIKKWNLMVPVNVVSQMWNEPNYDV